MIPQSLCVSRQKTQVEDRCLSQLQTKASSQGFDKKTGRLERILKTTEWQGSRFGPESKPNPGFTNI